MTRVEVAGAPVYRGRWWRTCAPVYRSGGRGGDRDRAVVLRSQKEAGDRRWCARVHLWGRRGRRCGGGRHGLGYEQPVASLDRLGWGLGRETCMER